MGPGSPATLLDVVEAVEAPCRFWPKASLITWAKSQARFPFHHVAHHYPMQLALNH